MGVPPRPAITSRSPRVLVSGSPAATERLGAALGARLAPGDLVLLVGPYGAGKTCFTRGIAKGAGVKDVRAVTSPTFVLMNVYAARVRIHHLDCHRMTPAEVVDLGLGDFLRQGAVVIEWGERVPPTLGESVLTVRLALTGPTRRTLALSSEGKRAADLLRGTARA